MTPTLYDYSASFQDRAAKEMDALPPPCDRLEPADPCSALKRFTNDYGHVRDEIRAAKRTK